MLVEMGLSNTFYYTSDDKLTLNIYADTFNAFLSLYIIYTFW